MMTGTAPVSRGRDSATPGPSARLAPPAGRQTSVLIADQLRELILDGTFRPGEQIGEANLAMQLQLSRGPVREALQRLAQEGLVVSHRNRGVFVVELTTRDISEIYSAREAIELAAARTLIVYAAGKRRAVAARLRLIVESMPALVESGDWAAAARADLQFHSTLVAEAGNSRLSRIYATLAAESRICMVNLRRAYLRPETLPAEHAHLVDLLETGTGNELDAAIRAHLSTAVDDLTTVMAGDAMEGNPARRTDAREDAGMDEPTHANDTATPGARGGQE